MDVEKLAIVKIISGQICPDLIPVTFVVKDGFLDLALLKVSSGYALPHGIELCETEHLPRHLKTGDDYRMFYYNVRDFNNGDDHTLTCCVTGSLTTQLVDNDSIKWPIVLNSGCSGSAVVNGAGKLIGIYRAYNATSFTKADGKNSLVAKIKSSVDDKKLVAGAVEDIKDDDSLSEALSLSSLSMQHSSYSSTPQSSARIMNLIRQQVSESSGK